MGGPCMPDGDTVAITGNLHIVTMVRQGLLTEVHLNLAGVMGTGKTGTVYIGTGSQKFSNLALPISSGDRVFAFNPTFTLEHTDGCASDQLPAIVTLAFDTAGNLINDNGGWGACTSGFCPGFGQ